MFARLATALGLVVLTALSIVRTTRPPAPKPASAPATEFSAERALKHVIQVAQHPHPMGTAEHDRVRDYILGQLAATGIRTEVQAATAVSTRYPAVGSAQNIVGYLPGATPGGKAVLIVVHYDGVGAGPAASDDGAGVGALLETLRALRAGQSPLKHDIIALFTDGEESGLLGAALFAREHPRAKDVAVILNFEARGTTGRSYMFETGAGNLDVARVLRKAGDVSAGSVYTMVYRALPNNTDLSELSALRVPAMNFAFTGGVERYHTSHDDVARLDLGSLQHHGSQMLPLAIAFASGELPRPVTGDGVFFDLPVIGLVVYPIWVSYPIALLVVVLFGLAVRDDHRGLVGGIGCVLVGIASCSAAAFFVRLSGPALWSGWYGAAIALATIGVNAALYIIAERRGGSRIAMLTVWSILAIGTTIAIPVVSYLFAWPALFALIAARSRHPVAEWVSAGFALMVLAGLASTAAVVMLGVSTVGALALALVTALLTWLCGPLLAQVFARESWALLVPGAAAAIALAVAKVVVKPSADHPVRTALVYAENVSNGEAFVGSTSRREPWTVTALGGASPGPAWTSVLGPYRQVMYGRTLPPVSIGAPSVEVVADSVVSNGRALTLRIRSPGTTATAMRVRGVRVLSAEVDGRVIDPAGYGMRLIDWGIEYWNVPPAGALLRLVVAQGGELEIAARRPGLPSTISIPARPEHVVPSQDGDVSIVYTKFRF